MAKQDFYALLGVPASASNDEIESAFEQASTSLLQRSDANTPDNQNRLKFLRFARETLLHKERRATYDASLARPKAQPAPGRQARAEKAGVPGTLIAAGAAVLALLAAGAWYAKSAKPKPVPALAAPPVLAPVSVATPAPSDDGATARTELSAEELFERNAKSVVVVVGMNGEGNPILQGSGVVVADQRVITNCHVAKSAASTLVRLGGKDYPSTLLRIDADPRHDLCLLAVEALHAPALQLADIKAVKVGQKVFALGAPKGLDLTLSEGIVSSLRKHEDSHFIQTTASISPGSSGGGLFNAAGDVIGITTFQHREGQNLNFAVPVDWVSKLLAQSDSLAVLSPDAVRDLEGAWTCNPSQGKGRVDFRFKRDGTFAIELPEAKRRIPEGNSTIAGNHTLVLKSKFAQPNEVYLQIMSLSYVSMQITSPFYQDEQTYFCRKS